MRTLNVAALLIALAWSTAAVVYVPCPITLTLAVALAAVWCRHLEECPPAGNPPTVPSTVADSTVSP